MYFYCPQTKFGQGNVFRHVCDLFPSWEGVLLGGGKVLSGGGAVKRGVSPSQQSGGTHPTSMLNFYRSF